MAFVALRGLLDAAPVSPLTLEIVVVAFLFSSRIRLRAPCQLLRPRVGAVLPTNTNF